MSRISLFTALAVTAALSTTAAAAPDSIPPADPDPAPAVSTEPSSTDALAPAKEPDPAPEAALPAPADAVQAKTTVAALDPARTSEEQPRDTGITTQALHRPRATPRIAVSGGVFFQDRGLDFDYDWEADGGPPTYSDSVKGFTAGAVVYPLPIQKYDGKLSGLGFGFQVAKSLGSTLVAADETGYGEYEVDHTAYNFAVSYLYPIDRFAIAGEVSYGNWSHAIIDVPESIALPDTSYSYLSAGAHAEAYANDRATIGAGVKYLGIVSAGDVSSEDWYGAGSGHGWVLDGDLTISLPAKLFVRGGVEWRKITYDFDGSGELSWYWGVGTMRDTAITGSAQLGVEL